MENLAEQCKGKHNLTYNFIHAMMQARNALKVCTPEDQFSTFAVPIAVTVPIAVPCGYFESVAMPHVAGGLCNSTALGRRESLVAHMGGHSEYLLPLS
jgi:hypothetical protein